MGISAAAAASASCVEAYRVPLPSAGGADALAVPASSAATCCNCIAFAVADEPAPSETGERTDELRTQLPGSEEKTPKKTSLSTTEV